ncbi:MAG: hypothetical protein KJ767_01190 [Nanoarchaeota archaeon]|nr:hypothetical protein [Nanoarchaeota archaeon]
MVKIDHRAEKLLKKIKEEQVKLEGLKVRAEATRKEIRGKVKEEAQKFDIEFRKNTVTAITAAFALIIGLVWKDIITGGIDYLIALTGLPQSQAYGLRIISAIILTFICVVGIILITRFMKRKES